MAKQKCENCNSEFSRKEIFKTSVRGFRRITCSKCGTTHKILEHYKVIIPCIVIFPIIAFYLIVAPFLHLTPHQILFYGVVLLVISIAILPFIVKYGLPEDHEI